MPKKHLETLFDAYPGLRLLTGDAIYAQHPLLEVLYEYGCGYLFQLKENQGEVYDAVKYCFHDAGSIEPDDVSLCKKIFGWILQPVLRPVGAEKFYDFAEALDRRTDVCVDQQVSPQQQGLRAKHGFEQGDDPHRHERPYAQNARKTSPAS